MAGRCKTCLHSGIETQAIPGADLCLLHSPTGTCSKCYAENGEMEDRCSKCGATLHDTELNQNSAESTRRLRQADSHPESPTKKDAKKSASTSETQDDSDMKAMMQRMMHMMGNLSTDMQSVKAGVTEAKETAQTAVTIAKDTEKQVSELQRHQLTRRDVQTMIDTTIGHKLLHQQSTTHHDMPTVLFGGMHDLSFEAAKDFIDTSMKTLQLPTPAIVYYKGDDFAGTIFAKFETLRAANEVVTKVSQSTIKANVWCKKDLPLETRCPLSVLLGLRRQLINWGFNRRAIRVKDDTLSMTIEGKPILTATTSSDQVSLDWLDQTWKEWKELQDSAELKLLIDRANDTLKNAAAKRTKGDGKGKPAGTGQ